MNINKEAIFPDLVAENISKWYLFDYDVFLDKNMSNLNNWLSIIGSTKIEVIIHRFFGRSDFNKFKSKVLDIPRDNLSDFLNKKVLDGNARELFLEAAFITDHEKFVIYLDKPLELVLFGLEDDHFTKDFERAFEPYKTTSLKQNIEYIFNFGFKNIPENDELKHAFLKNYFKSSI